MKNTRKFDLDELEQHRSEAKTKDDKRHRLALLEAVYEMSKDGFLEKMRIQLIDALKYGDLRKMAEIRRKISDYCQSLSFRKNIAKKINKVAGENEAEKWFNKF